MPAADSAPGENFSVARYHLLHHTAVSVVSVDIRVFECVFPPGMTGGAADGATATAASVAETGVGVDTDPNPATAALPAAEHISSFLLHIRRCADDVAAGPDLGDAAPLDTGTDVVVGTAPGVAVPVAAADPTHHRRHGCRHCR